MGNVPSVSRFEETFFHVASGSVLCLGYDRVPDANGFSLTDAQSQAALGIETTREDLESTCEVTIVATVSIVGCEKNPVFRVENLDRLVATGGDHELTIWTEGN